MKRCSKCKEEKPLADFPKNKNKKSGYESACKSCAKIKQREWYKKNRQHVIEKSARWAKSNPEKVTAIKKSWTEKNRDNINERSREYRENNKEKRQETVRRYYVRNKGKVAAYQQKYKEENPDVIYARIQNWRKRHPEKIKHYIRTANSKRRAQSVSVDENYTIEMSTFVLNAFNHSCFNCGSEENLHHDHHRPLVLGYPLEPGNAVILCQSCNAKKWKFMPEEFYDEHKLAELEQILASHRELFYQKHKNNTNYS